MIVTTMSPDFILHVNDASGWIRERALRELMAEDAGSHTVSAVLQRLNDWVPQVRDAAQAALLRLLPALHTQALLDALPALSALQRGRRADHSEAVRLLTQRLDPGADGAARKALLDHVRGPQRAPARFVFDLLQRRARAPGAPAHELREVIEAGLNAQDLGLAKRAGQALRHLQDPADRSRLVAAGLASRQAPARMGALRALVQDTTSGTPVPAVLQPAVTRCALDTNGTVRQLAIALLGGASDELLALATAHAQGASASPRQRAIALHLVADLGLPAGRSVALVHVHDAAPVVRRAAYNAAYRLGAQDADALTLQALSDPATSVFRLALRWADRLGTRPTPDALQAHSHSDDPVHWSRAMQLLTTASTWGQLAWLLNAPAPLRTKAARPLLDTAVQQVQASLQRNSVSPSDTERATLADLLARNGRGVLGSQHAPVRVELRRMGL